MYRRLFGKAPKETRRITRIDALGQYMISDHYWINRIDRGHGSIILRGRMREYALRAMYKSDDWRTLIFPNEEEQVYPKVRHAAEWLNKIPGKKILGIVDQLTFPPGFNRIKIMKEVLGSDLPYPLQRYEVLDQPDLLLFEGPEFGTFWGVNKHGRGKNHLGILLMKLHQKWIDKKKAEAERHRRVWARATSDLIWDGR